MGVVSIKGRAARQGTGRVPMTTWTSESTRSVFGEHLVGGSTGTAVEASMIITAELVKIMDGHFTIESADIEKSICGDPEADDARKKAGLLKLLIAAAARHHAEHPEEFEGL